MECPACGILIASEAEISGSNPIEINSPTPIAKLPSPIARSAIKKVGDGASFDTAGDNKGDDKPWTSKVMITYSR